MFDSFKKPKVVPPADSGTQERPAAAPGWASTMVSKEKLIEKLKEPKDVRLRVSAGGEVAADCKTCREPMRPAEKDNLLWLLCVRCRHVTFVPLANLQRDIAWAREEGGLFEYELFFLRDLPPGLSPPETLNRVG